MSAVSVMVVDDDPFIREVVAAALGIKPGVHVQSFATSAEALTAARAAAPDIVVLDFTLPGTDGIEVLRDLRRVLAPSPPVIFLTAREDADVVARLHAAGAAGVLAKPFDPTKIADDILRLGARERGGPMRDARLDAVAASFRASLPQTMAEIDQEWGVLRREWQRAAAERLVMRVHKLAGAAGLFKLNDFGNAARAVEVSVQTQLDGEARGEPTHAAALEPAIAKLWDAAIAATGSGHGGV
jgi:DNA-binding response OmpR family regulator